MALNPPQKLLVLMVDPTKTPDLTTVLENYPWWGEGWKIQQVSLSPHGERNTHVFVAVVLERNDEETSDIDRLLAATDED